MNHYPADMLVDDLPATPEPRRLSWPEFAHEHPNEARAADEGFMNTLSALELMSDLIDADGYGHLIQVCGSKLICAMRAERRKAVEAMGYELVK